MFEKRNNGSNKPERKIFKFKKLKKVDKDIISNNDLITDKGVKDPKSKTKKKSKGKVFKIVLFVLLALLIIGTGVVIGVITGIIDKTDTIDVASLSLKQTSHLYDKDGNIFDSFSGAEDRDEVDYKDLPQNLVNAVTSIEDERFFKHKGIDIKRTAGAIFNYVIHAGKSNYGGSTITQQLVKNLTSDNEKKWTRKVREWYGAITLEKKLSKEKIFELYANTIFLGDNSYGVEVASKNYFNKDVKDINLAESAALAAMIQSPTTYNPYKSDDAKKLLLERQKLVLKQMLKLKKIDQNQYDEAVKYDIVFQKEAKSTTKVHSYYSDAVFEKVKDDLMEQKNLSEDAAVEMIYSGGLKIYTPYDPSVQKAIDDTYDNDKIFVTDKDGKFMQSSMVVIDQSNGNVAGLIGGADEKTADRVLNRAVDTPRQPGSTMKVLAAYGPAFEKGIIGTDTGVDDCQLTNLSYNPGNYYSGFNGYVTVRQALAKSMNLPAIRTLQKVGVDYAYNFAKNCGLSHLVDSDKNLPMAIGGLSYGATVLEMANAYATVANGGIYMTPKLYIKVLDSNDKEILTQDTTAKRVMKETTAYMLTDCLKSVVQSGGTAYPFVKLGTKMAVAGKTGETNKNIDQWYIGYTPYYTVACWNGYDDGKTPIDKGYPYPSVKLVNSVLKDINKDKEVKDFEKPDGLVSVQVCKVSGLIPTDACRQDPRGDQTITSLFDEDSVPTKTCDIHKLIKIDSTNGLLATDDTPNVVERSFITRDYTPAVKPRDWGYMAPTEYSTNKKVVEVPPTVPTDNKSGGTTTTQTQ